MTSSIFPLERPVFGENFNFILLMDLKVEVRNTHETFRRDIWFMFVIKIMAVNILRFKENFTIPPLWFYRSFCTNFLKTTWQWKIV